MKVTNVETEVRTGNALKSATVQLSEREIRFIVGANRKINEEYNKGSERDNDEIMKYNDKLHQLLSPRLEEVLLVIDTQFLDSFNPYDEVTHDDIVADNMETNYKKRKGEY